MNVKEQGNGQRSMGMSYQRLTAVRTRLYVPYAGVCVWETKVNISAWGFGVARFDIRAITRASDRRTSDRHRFHVFRIVIDQPYLCRPLLLVINKDTCHKQINLFIGYAQTDNCTIKYRYRKTTQFITCIKKLWN